MARVKQGFLGNASGKLGSVVFAKNRKTNTVRKHQPVIQDKKSPAQLTHRQAMKVITSALAPLKNNFIPFFNKGISGKASPWSYAIKQNINSLDINGNFDLSKLQLGKPSLPITLINSVIYNPFIDQLSITTTANNILQTTVNFSINFFSFIGQYKTINNQISFDTRNLSIQSNHGVVYCFVSSDAQFSVYQNFYNNGRLYKQTLLGAYY
jgi:hypothetical protein